MPPPYVSYAMEDIRSKEADKYRKIGNAKLREMKYGEANVAYADALTTWPIDHRILGDLSKCYAETHRWHKSAEAAWHCMHICKEFPKANWRLSRALIKLQLYGAALIVVQEGLLNNPGNEELESVQTHLYTRVETQPCTRTRSQANDSVFWFCIALFLNDCDVKHLAVAADYIRHDIFQSRASKSGKIFFSQDGVMSGGWQYCPPWVVSMLLGAISHVDISCAFVLAPSDLQAFFLFSVCCAGLV